MGLLRKAGAFVAEQWPYLLGASAFAGVVGIAIATRPQVGPQTFVPPKPLDPKAQRFRWLAIEGSPVMLERGRRYRGCVEVPFVVPTGMVVDRLPAALAEKGFVDVLISRPRPSDWPDVECDIHVEVTWGRDDEPLERPGAVVLAWRGEPLA